MDSLSRKQGMVWGGLLIFFGAMGLIQTVADLSDWGWVALLTIAGFVVLAVFLTDTSDWTLLIPAYVMFAVAGLIALITLDVLRDEFIATYVLTAIAAPFVVVFGRDRNQWWALIPAGVMGAIGLAFLLAGAAVQYILPVALILAGIFLLARQFMRSEPTPPDAAP